ncbi:MAG: glycosyltransferase family 4 protein [Chlamydiota bacterium]
MHLEASTGWGGQEMRILEEATVMRKRGYKILLVVEKGALLKKRAEERGFLVYECSFRKRYWWKTFWYLLYLLRKEQVDILNTHSSLDAWIGGFVGKVLRKPVIRTRHLSAPIKKGWNSKILYKLLADYVVTTCEEMVPKIVEQARQAKGRCLSIPTGILPENVVYDFAEKRSWEERFGIQPTDFIVGTACFMRSWKGIEDLLEAAHLLKQEKRIKFVLVGGGNQAYYQKRAEELGLGESVFFTGHLEKPFSAMALFDVFVLLSRANEGVSQASLQAAFLGLGRPLITTRVGGLPEVCQHFKTGIQVPTRSPAAVSEAILRLKNEEGLTKRLGKRAKELVLNKFTQTSMADQIEQIYQKIRASS